MKNLNLKIARTTLFCTLALVGLLAVSAPAAHADLTGPKPPNPPVTLTTGDVTATAQDFVFGAR